MSEQEIDASAGRPRVHHYMNADGFCHAGDMFERGMGSISLYTAEELIRIVNAEMAEAWDQGHGTSNGGCVYWPDCAAIGDHVNPYRPTTRAALTEGEVSCPCGCPADMHIGDIGCPCALPGEPPCAAEHLTSPTESAEESNRD